MLILRLFVAATVISITCAGPAGGEEAVATWPQWRGPGRDGHVETPGAWPDTLAEGVLRPLWRVPLGPGYSGPVVSQDTVFVTETVDRQREVVRALDRGTGQQRWEAAWDGSLSVPFFAKSNGDWIRSTPAFDGESLYVAGMRDVLVCLDAQSGAERWRVDFVQQLEAPLPAFGFVCSPLVDGSSLYVQAGASCCKLDKQTGKLIWRTLKDDGGMMGSAFSSPVLTTVAGRRQLLVQTREALAGVDPESGNVLWSVSVPTFRGMNILTPTVFGDSIFTSSYGGKTFLFDIRGGGEALTAHEAWTNKVTGYMSTPVVINGHVYLHLRNQRFTCIDLANGQTKWTTTPFGKYWSLVANGEKILALDERGELLLIRANPDRFEALDRRTVSEDSTWAHLAVCDGDVVVRALNDVAMYRWEEAAQ